MENTPAPVVVTGISSFVGCHLAVRFADIGARVVGTTTGSRLDGVRLERVETVIRAGAEHKTLDMTNANALRSFIDDTRPALWLHHAGWAKDYASPDYNLERAHAVNVAPLASLYPALADAGCRGVIVTGSDAEYASGDAPHREDEACLPPLPYGLSKLAETIRASQLAARYALPTRVARLFIPYGPMDAPKKLIPSVLKALKEDRPVELTPCIQKRDFLHIEDVTRAYAAMAERLDGGPLFEIFNVCGGQAVRLRDFLLHIARMLDADPELLHFGARDMRPGEAPVCHGDIQKALTLLDWKPRPLEEGLAAFAE